MVPDKKTMRFLEQFIRFMTAQNLMCYMSIFAGSPAEAPTAPKPQAAPPAPAPIKAPQATDMKLKVTNPEVRRKSAPKGRQGRVLGSRGTFAFAPETTAGKVGAGQSALGAGVGR